MRFPPSEIVSTVVPTTEMPASPVTLLKTVICPPLGNVSVPVKTMVASLAAGL